MGTSILLFFPISPDLMSFSVPASAVAEVGSA